MLKRVSLESGSLRMTCDVLPAYTLAAHQSMGSPLARVQVMNIGDTPSAPAVAHARLEGLGQVWPVSIPGLASGQSCEVLVDRPRSLWNSLASITHVHADWLTVRMGEAEEKVDMPLFAPWEWPASLDTIPMLGALVVKGNAVIGAICAEAKIRLADGMDTKSNNPAMRQLACLYEVLARDYKIAYAEPLLYPDVSGVRIQRIRPPYAVIPHLQEVRGEGCCLDLSLFLASCLEAWDFAPIVLLKGEIAGSPAHAILGLYRDGRPGSRPIVSDTTRLQRDVADGHLIALEATGLCVGPGHALSFAEALAHGRELVEDERHLWALDILASRPPKGNVLAMEMPQDPIVYHVIDAAERLCHELSRPRLQTLHILYGLWATRGPVTQAIAQECSATLGRLVREIRTKLDGPSMIGTLEQTDNYRTGFEKASQYATDRGSRLIEEGDLWWALQYMNHEGVEEILDQAHCRRPVRRRILMELCPHMTNHTTELHSFGS